MKQVKVFDNYLPDLVFKNLVHSITTVPWKYDDIVASEYNDQSTCDKRYDWQMSHHFYNHPFHRSDEFNIIQPLLEKINPVVLYRAKLNLTTVSNNIEEHGFHVDYEPIEDGKIFTSAVYYLNTNDGYTKFQDGTKIESVANRLVVFPTDLEHTGSTCTNAKNRLVLNLVYIPRSDNA
jgi:hypothetical protein